MLALLAHERVLALVMGFYALVCGSGHRGPLYFEDGK